MRATAPAISPGGFAYRASRGRWTFPGHLKLLNRRVVGTVAGRSGGQPGRLIVTMPPRHGKSHFVSQYFPAWFLGTFPDRRVILSSYEADFAASWGRKVRDILDEHGHGFFGVHVRRDSSAADRWDIEGHPGGMITAGVGGPITGRGADLLIVDDPVKNAEEAASPTIRRKHKDWWRSTAYTRLEPGAIAIIMCTRWHQDDLPGWLIEEAASGGDRWDVLNLPALAEEGDPLGRPTGEPLWPERFPIPVLEQIRRSIGEYWFAAMYQGRPAPESGGMFPSGWPIVEAVGHGSSSVRYWDKAGTSGGGAYTAGVLMARSSEGRYFIVDVVRGQWSAAEREAVIKQTAMLDGRQTQVWVEQEPGSGGKESAENTVRNLAGFAIQAERVTGDKETRARPFASQAEVGNVALLAGPWNRAFIEEAKLFPNGKYKDQIDAASGAFNKLALRGGGGPARILPARESSRIVIR